MAETYQKMLWETYERVVCTDTMPLTSNVKGLSLEAQEKSCPRIRSYVSGQNEGLSLLRKFLESLGMRWIPGGTDRLVQEAHNDYFLDSASNTLLTLTQYCARDGTTILKGFITASGIFIRSHDKNVCDRLADQIESAMAEIRAKIRTKEEATAPATH